MRFLGSAGAVATVFGMASIGGAIENGSGMVQSLVIFAIGVAVVSLYQRFNA